MSEAPSIVWFWQDLRLNDNPAVDAAVEAGGPVIFLYIHSPDEEGEWAPGGAAKWWLHHSLTSLRDDLDSRGSQLVLRSGDAKGVLDKVIEESGATHLFWNRRYEPAIRERDTEIYQQLSDKEIHCSVPNGHLIHNPKQISTKAGDPYKVFTPFFRSMKEQLNFEEPTTAPTRFKNPDISLESESLDDWKLLPTLDWDEQFPDRWTPGEKGARDHLERFLDKAVKQYPDHRNRPDLFGTSRLSPHLHFGEISPRQVWWAVEEWYGEHAGKHVRKACDVFLSEVGWREFAYHLLWHFPETPTTALREKFRDFPWETSASQLKAWQQGQTGFPIVDAAMRELWHTGWMHNRCRMIVASFLTKDLLIPWQEGAEWFWDTLVDSDLASNTLGWQWTAGCGADAAPYFRVFNPTSQGQKFDPDGDYIRKWCPELKSLPTKHIHEPSAAPENVLQEAGIKIGKHYPEPIVDHGDARKAALAAYEAIK